MTTPKPKKHRKPRRPVGVKAPNHYANNYWRKQPTWKLASHIIQCHMQFISSGKEVVLDGRKCWVISNKELGAWERAANKAAKRVVSELRRRVSK